MPAPRSTIRERRLARLAGPPLPAGMLGIASAAALAGVGFEQVSEVIGAIAFEVPPRSFFAYGTGMLFTPTYPPGWQGSVDGGPPPVLTSSIRPDGRVPAAVTALKYGYRTALRRLVEEVSAVGGDGAVGVRVQRTTLAADGGGRDVWNFLATGTAVRSRGRTRAGTPFTCALDATEVAAAVRAGWLPLQFLACPVMAVRWIAPDERRQGRRATANRELDAQTATVNACRHQARTDFAAAAARAGGVGAIMSDMSLEVGDALDIAEASVLVTGTALTPFEPTATPDVRTALSMADQT